MNIEQFIENLKVNGINLTADQLEQFACYYDRLIEWNEKINLTAITVKEEVYLKHFYDSLMMLWTMPLDDYHIRLIDVGSGAGFPSIPLKIVKPELEITIIDSLNKRINFLSALVEELNLEKVTLVHGRAEDLGQDKAYRAQYDIATARAVASLNVLSEFCLPFVKKGGQFIALKAAKAEAELAEAQRAITELGAKLETAETAILPIEDSERIFIKIKKTLDTPKKYPRKAGKPSKQPIK